MAAVSLRIDDFFFDQTSYLKLHLLTQRLVTFHKLRLAGQKYFIFFEQLLKINSIRTTDAFLRHDRQ